MTNWNAVSAFMATVVPWPATLTDAGFVNLQYSFKDRQTGDGRRNGKFPVAAGWPFKAVDAFVSRAAWLNSTDQFKDAWFCLSLQSKDGASTRNPTKRKAVRLAANAMAVKAIWVDIDVKPDGYATLNDALKAIMSFQINAGLPPFSALVASGSGLHAYWISDNKLSPAEWAPYAHGLKSLLLQHGIKCDAGLTTDIARILRVPGTFNHKTDPPKPVQLLDVPLVCYNFPEKLGFLTQLAPADIPSAAGKAPTPLFADGADMSLFKAGPNAAFAALPVGEKLAEKVDEILLPIAPIFKDCGMYREALRTGGAGYGNELWMLSVLGTTFMENGNAVAHEISKGHATYSPADTQALYDRKVAERADRGIGYPSCAAIAGAGSSACATCPLFGKGKSPLNLRAPVTAAVKPPPPPVPGHNLTEVAALLASLDQPYELNNQGIICRVVERKNDEGDLVPVLIPLFQRVLSGFWSQKGSSDVLNYTVEVDKGFVHEAAVPMEEFPKQNFAAYLMTPACRTLPNPKGVQFLGELYMSILGKLWEASSSQEAIPFGWYYENGKRRGFAYGGQLHMDDGTVRPCGIGDAQIKRIYTPKGDIQAWFDAAATVTNRKRSELTAIMLMSFASPLLQMTGHKSVMLSAWGDPGAGKSAAFSVGMGVWGHPILSKGSQASTKNGITNQMKEIMNLPFYWDEIKSDTDREVVADVMHEASDGAEKARMKNGSQQQARGMFKLMIMQASNGSFREYLQERNKNHMASLVRVLEWHVKKIDHGPGHLDDVVATQILARLEQSYGLMGMRYASWLAQNHMRIEQDVLVTAKEVQDHFKIGNAERFWIAGTTVMILAARYAKMLGVDVDENDIRDFMYQVQAENIKALDKIGGAGGVIDHTETALQIYLKQRGSEERIIWTNYIHLAQGKPPKPVTILKGLTQPRNTAGGIEVRVSVDDRLVIIAQQDFNKFLADKKYTKAQVHAGLERDFGAVFKEKVRMLSGTVHGGAAPLREPAILIPVDPTGSLWDFLMQYSSPEERTAAEASEPPPRTPTGLEDMDPAGHG